jgi:hypothetical protein
MTDTPDLAALIVAVVIFGLGVLTIVLWRRAFHGHDARPRLIAEGTDSPEDEEELPPLEDDPVAIRLGLAGDPVQRMFLLMASGEGYIPYGSTYVHPCCLVDRREGRPMCARCAQVMAGVAR